LQAQHFIGPPELPATFLRLRRTDLAGQVKHIGVTANVELRAGMAMAEAMRADAYPWEDARRGHVGVNSLERSRRVLAPCAFRLRGRGPADDRRKAPGGVPFAPIAGEEVVATDRADSGHLDGLGRQTGTR